MATSTFTLTFLPPEVWMVRVGTLEEAVVVDVEPVDPPLEVLAVEACKLEEVAAELEDDLLLEPSEVPPHPASSKSESRTSSIFAEFTGG
ncbi:MAG: hypothetical protein ACR2GU_08110 [Rubrobacteraceae bacterium]